MNEDPNITDAGSKLDETPEETAERIRLHADNYWTLRNKLIVITTAISTAGLLVSLFSLYLTLSFAESQRNLREQDKTIQAKERQQELIRQEESRKQDFERQRSLKEIDLRQSFQTRYDELTTKSKVASEQDATTYYRRFWRLQLEEYQYWCDGMIDEDLYDTWANSRRYEWQTDPPLTYKSGSYPYKQGWKYMKDYFNKRDRGSHTQYERFIRFFDNIIFGSETRPNPREHCT